MTTISAVVFEHLRRSFATVNLILFAGSYWHVPNATFRRATR
jgi:hypothetical protein